MTDGGQATSAAPVTSRLSRTDRLLPLWIALAMAGGLALGSLILTDDLIAQAEVVVTMGCGDACPYIPGKQYVDWDLPDPTGQPVDIVRVTRDEVAHRVEDLLRMLDSTSTHDS